MNAHKAIQRAIAAHERRHGQSVLPIKATVCSPSLVPCLGENGGKQFIRTVDHENGSVCDWSFQGSRIRRIGERLPTN